MLDFQIFKFVVTTHVEMTNVHRHTNFVKIGQTVAEISYLTTFKMAAVCHFEFVWQINFGTTHNENLVVFLTVQNLVGIELVVFL